jgi:hypothetical protein
MQFDLTRPCGNCPFRADVQPFIHAARVREVLGDPAATGAAYWPASSFACRAIRARGREDVTVLGIGQREFAQ